MDLACSHELFDNEHVSSFNHVHVNTSLDICSLLSI